MTIRMMCQRCKNEFEPVADRAERGIICPRCRAESRVNFILNLSIAGCLLTILVIVITNAGYRDGVLKALALSAPCAILTLLMVIRSARAIMRYHVAYEMSAFLRSDKREIGEYHDWLAAVLNAVFLLLLTPAVGIFILAVCTALSAI